MVNTHDILETIKMIREENLDIRTVTMGISLFDCISDDPARLEQKIYDKITLSAKRLVSVCEDLEATYGIPIVNKRISVTPISLVGAGLSMLLGPLFPMQVIVPVEAFVALPAIAIVIGILRNLDDNLDPTFFAILADGEVERVGSNHSAVLFGFDKVSHNCLDDLGTNLVCSCSFHFIYFLSFGVY
jgi:hypothetical protein